MVFYYWYYKEKKLQCWCWRIVRKDYYLYILGMSSGAPVSSSLSPSACSDDTTCLIFAYHPSAAFTYNHSCFVTPSFISSSFVLDRELSEVFYLTRFVKSMYDMGSVHCLPFLYDCWASQLVISFISPWCLHKLIQKWWLVGGAVTSVEIWTSVTL